ncbi:Type 1 glutamine amidotransferase-like domain-containing protein [uncultured Rothia sp.]|uniref:Type 1 glutamine amidotransferase-like domain-containing protein n=1 Tax=uncultured Rothia sp. TaxID=316088 RepID=UPI003216435A
MKILLTSFLHERIREFVEGNTLAYLNDAARSYGQAPFIEREKNYLKDLGFSLVKFSASSISVSEMENILDQADALYVAGGETWDLL